MKSRPVLKEKGYFGTWPPAAMHWAWSDSLALAVSATIGKLANSVASETRHYFYLVRLLAFVLIIAGILDKNLARRRH